MYKACFFFIQFTTLTVKQMVTENFVGDIYLQLYIIAKEFHNYAIYFRTLKLKTVFDTHESTIFYFFASFLFLMAFPKLLLYVLP